nr:polysaccharide biosynthesis tyrosine autokinase [Planosporangium mesophilum]
MRDYLRAIRKRWWLLPAAVALAVSVAAVITLRTPPQYATTTTFFIGTPNRGVTDAYQGSLLSQQRVKSYGTLITGDRLAAVVAKQPGVGLSPDQVQQRITAQPVPETVLLQATVTDGSKQRSKLIADVLAAQFTKMVESLETPATAGTPTPAAPLASTVKVEVIAGPKLDETPVSPRPARNLGLAVLLGLLVGAAIAVLRELLDNTVKSAEALQELAGAPVLAMIPNDPEAAKAPLVTGSAQRSARAEALRKLRTNLQFVDVDRPVRVMVVTSALPSEGKSSTSANLAIVFAEAGQRVLLIDADLRRPKVAEYFGIEGAVGLTNLLAGQAQPEDVIQRWSQGLWILPSGFLPPNPSELLASQHMADLLGTFRERFDVVVIDSPPLLPVTDAAILTTVADGAVLVVRAAKTSTAQVTGALQALETVNARLLGCALNLVPGMKSENYYYYGQDEGGRSNGKRVPAALTASASPARATSAQHARSVSAPPAPPASGPPARPISAPPAAPVSGAAPRVGRASVGAPPSNMGPRTKEQSPAYGETTVPTPTRSGPR